MKKSTLTVEQGEYITLKATVDTSSLKVAQALLALGAKMMEKYDENAEQVFDIVEMLPGFKWKVPPCITTNDDIRSTLRTQAVSNIDKMLAM